jgi:hypothetical protein
MPFGPIVAAAGAAKGAAAQDPVQTGCCGAFLPAACDGTAQTAAIHAVAMTVLRLRLAAAGTLAIIW